MHPFHTKSSKSCPGYGGASCNDNIWRMEQKDCEFKPSLCCKKKILPKTKKPPSFPLNFSVFLLLAHASSGWLYFSCSCFGGHHIEQADLGSMHIQTYLLSLRPFPLMRSMLPPQTQHQAKKAAHLSASVRLLVIPPALQVTVSDT